MASSKKNTNVNREKLKDETPNEKHQTRNGKRETRNGQPEKKYEELHFIDTSKNVWSYSLFTDEDVKNFQAGTHYSMYKFLGKIGRAHV